MKIFQTIKVTALCIGCLCLMCTPYGVKGAELGGSGVSSGWTIGSEGVIVDTIRDEDTMTSDDANALATQQSIKAYVDSQAGAVIEDDVWGSGWNGDTTNGASQNAIHDVLLGFDSDYDSLVDGIQFIDQDTSPSVVGDLTYDNTVTGLTDGALAWYDDDAIRYLVDLDTLPSNDDYVVAYDADADKFYMKEDSGGGGSTAWDDIGDPDADATIAFTGYEQAITSTLDEANHSMLTLDHTDADVTTATTLLKIQSVDDADADLTYLEIVDDSGGTPNTVFKIGADGATTIDADMEITNSDNVFKINGTQVIRIIDDTLTYTNFIFGNAGDNMTATAQGNFAFGYDTLLGLTTGDRNVGLGSYCMYNATVTGSDNVGIGYGIMQELDEGNHNVGIGTLSLMEITGGDYNVGLGSYAMKSITTANRNVAVGYQAGYSSTAGDENVLIGYRAGFSGTTSDSNVFIGYQAGYNETNSDRLYLENSDSASPLIYGEFDNDLLKVNGQFAVGVSGVTDVVAATGITVTTGIMRIQSSTAGDADISADPQIANGTEGQIVRFHCEDDTKTVTFDDGTGLHTSGTFVCGARDTIELMYVNADWVELSRSNN